MNSATNDSRPSGTTAIELSFALVRDAHSVSEMSGTTVANQIDLWAAFGRIVEAHLREDHPLRLQAVADSIVGIDEDRSSS